MEAFFRSNLKNAYQVNQYGKLLTAVRVSISCLGVKLLWFLNFLKKADKKIKGVLSVYNSLNIQSVCEHEADKHTQVAVNYLEKVNANQTKKQALKTFALELLNRQM